MRKREVESGDSNLWIYPLPFSFQESRVEACGVCHQNFMNISIQIWIFGGDAQQKLRGENVSNMVHKQNDYYFFTSKYVTRIVNLVFYSILTLYLELRRNLGTI